MNSIAIDRQQLLPWLALLLAVAVIGALLFVIARALVSARQHARRNEQLEQASDFCTRVLDGAAFGLAAVDEHGRFVLANRHFAAIVGYAIEELIGQPYAILLAPESA